MLMVQTKHIPSQLCLAAKTRLSIPDIQDYAEETVGPLYEKAQSLGLEPQAPLEFIYHGIDDRPGTVFELVVALPVKEKRTSEGVEFIETRSGLVAYEDYKGSMQDIGKAWSQFVHRLRDENLNLSNECREVYKHWVDFNSDENITELQIGIQ